MGESIKKRIYMESLPDRQGGENLPVPAASLPVR